ncbi:hypothetical protein K469DRAFT_696061 [Zopfia rhizophila CBS 207.26]|uniref:Uncharacterized protein n=1 Tax=Zopfia rhizophila CBS 207.26 TaxID=1314779 RepID=A0A6A6ELG0_9PEZI|nr:hypothetical protein K469DRAFT_696061 [Zopfia rhizophila CBS 207.26]
MSSFSCMPSLDAQISPVGHHVPRFEAPSGSFPTATIPRLLRLPQELRDIIYDYLFQGACYEFDEYQMSFTISYNDDFDSYSGLPIWLLTCKQILYEALEQFHRQAQCIGYSRRDPESGDDFSSSLVSLYRIRTISAHNLQALVIVGDGLFDMYRLNDEKKVLATVLPAQVDGYADNMLHALIHHLQLQGTQLKDFTLRLRFPSEFPPAHKVEAWKVDFSLFEKLGALDRVEFLVDPPLWEMYPDHIQERATLFPLVQRELLRVGKLLVGLQGVGWAVRDWFGCNDSNNTENCLGIEHEWHLEVKKGVNREQK